MNCPLCFSADSSVFAAWPDFSVLQCRDCGFRFVDTAALYYPQNAQFAFDEPVSGPLRPDWPHIQRRVRDVLRFTLPPGRVLDIGCGKGELALALHEKGFECSGVDMKPDAISYLRTHCPQVSWHCIATGALAALGKHFDVLTLYHVFEHVADSRATLATVKALANPGGLIVIEVPNVGGLEARLKGRRWHYYKADHVNYFRESDLRRLAAELDLTVLGVRGYQHFSYPQNIVWKDMLKGALGWLGFQDVISVFLRVK